MLTIIISWKDSTWENKLKAHKEYLDFTAPSVYSKFHIQVPLCDREVFAFGLSRGTHSGYDCVPECTEILNRYQYVSL